jgi:Arc/MetJ-type ribon-helix-helix transcriptional regulator
MDIFALRTAISRKGLSTFVNRIVYGDPLAQVQLRLPQKMLEEIDKWVAEGRFKSRSDAIRTILSLYQEREKTREFYKMLLKRSEEAKRHPEALIPLEEL